MAKIKTAELIGPALDWAVAKCEGWKSEPEAEQYGVFTGLLYPPEAFIPDEGGGLPNLAYSDFTSLRELTFSTDWLQGGPILDREQITLLRPYFHCNEKWLALKNGTLLCEERFGGIQASGSTPLIAAMRCYVASLLGAVVEIPDELLEVK